MTIKQKAQRAIELKKEMTLIKSKLKELEEEYNNMTNYIFEKKGEGEHKIGNVIVKYTFIEEAPVSFIRKAHHRVYVKEVK